MGCAQGEKISIRRNEFGPILTAGIRGRGEEEERKNVKRSFHQPMGRGRRMPISIEYRRKKPPSSTSIDSRERTKEIPIGKKRTTAKSNQSAIPAGKKETFEESRSSFSISRLNERKGWKRKWFTARVGERPIPISAEKRKKKVREGNGRQVSI